ncbi:hypothetical protein RO3G_09725 [Rhizopus delemar RA 99-880]|uniref:Uncharacterized protein n=1 Tax=Rhizopus delemar (strain RA 99-880 / ATCC MYA-4621 / FGSC 9543 / NRRL 43880) TaxID=246409 RepID=I1C985_RHIO9|nr:hypothetical protein RO3G_09725 [Rhizopus delemar RA 99-880]|eukprot:EIE85015.1 hypothetical protein RO3G_09725 [Rhizopus delemar RA 99-880]
MGMDCRNNQTAIDAFTSPLFHKHQNRSGSNNFKLLGAFLSIHPKVLEGLAYG